VFWIAWIGSAEMVGLTEVIMVVGGTVNVVKVEVEVEVVVVEVVAVEEELTKVEVEMASLMSDTSVEKGLSF
jgi:hypothetical protein